jgi:hypothetical protein
MSTTASSSLHTFANGLGLVPAMPAPPLIDERSPAAVSTASPSPRPVTRIRPWMVVMLALLFFSGLCVWWVTGFFRLGSETAALRNSMMASTGAAWKTRLALNFGRVSFGLVQLGTGFIQMPPEGRAALNGLQRAEVGIYEMTDNVRPVNPSAVLQSADKAMARRGWVRVVGAVKENNLVAVYSPKKGRASSRIECSIMVLHEHRMVLVGARANPDELIHVLPNSISWEKGIRHVAVNSGSAG